MCRVCIRTGRLMLHILLCEHCCTVRGPVPLGCCGLGNGRQVNLGAPRDTRSQGTVAVHDCSAWLHALLVAVFAKLSRQRRAGALLFAPGRDQLTEDNCADISHRFPVMRSHTHTCSEQYLGYIWVYPDIRLHIIITHACIQRFM